MTTIQNPSSSPDQTRKKQWRNYEEVARHLLTLIAEDFGVDFFEGKQKVDGQKSKTKWQIDAKGVNTGNNSFIVVECRMFGNDQKQSQAKLAEVAYIISDVGASGGIMVSPYHLQSGAALVAAANNIQTVILTPESTVESFQMEFVDKLKVYAGIPMFVKGS